MVKGNETITVGCIYDDNRNTTRTLTKLEELLDKIDGRQGLVIGGDYNVILNPLLYQHVYDTPHLITKAVKHHNEEASEMLIDSYRKNFRSRRWGSLFVEIFQILHPKAYKNLLHE